MDARLYVNSDGTATIEYWIDFQNDSDGHPIEYVDIGTPNDNYDLDSITAEVNGQPVSTFIKSEYQGEGTGFAVYLGTLSIPPGESGQFHIRIGTINKILYKADKPDNYASVQFSPVYFDPDACHGWTNYQFTLFLPAGMNPDEPRWYPPSSNWRGENEPETGFDQEGRVFYTWKSDQANAYTMYIFGGGFPDTLVPKEALQTKPLININIDFEAVFAWCLVCGFIAFPIGIGILGTLQEKKRKLKYLSPKIAIEGHGIKRGLTAVQAAVLMETPVDKIMTMILFSTIKKGAAKVIKREPLQLEVASPLPDDLHFYEKEFLEAFKSENLRERRKKLQDMMVKLVQNVSSAMKGFSRKETITYYESIMQRAWQQVESADTPEVMMKAFDEGMDWTMLDKRFDDRTREVFRTRPVYVPMWWGRFDPTFSSPRPASAGAPSAGGGGVSIPGSFSMPHLPGSDFAASMINGMQNFSANVVGNLTTFTEGITKTTNPIPKSSYSSSRRGGSGGGGGCACACACACAGCACACAGGGR